MCICQRRSFLLRALGARTCHQRGPYTLLEDQEPNTGHAPGPVADAAAGGLSLPPTCQCVVVVALEALADEGMRLVPVHGPAVLRAVGEPGGLLILTANS